ncbi:MAG TPA: CvpA family protein [Ktedonobacteraceae bacterium]|nr:CvpA family protein [Ktedonobacteraceae bacterium]
MELLLSSQQCFFIAIVGFGLIGFIRGWRREVISLAFALTAVLFLLLNGGSALAQIVFIKLPVAFQYFFGSGSPQKPPSPSAQQTLIVTLVAFVLIVVIGYMVGNRAFPAKGNALSPADRLLGILPGLVTGYFLITYISNTFARNPVISVGVGTPSQDVLTNYVPLLFVVAIVVVIAGLIASRAKKGGAPAKK